MPLRDRCSRLGWGLSDLAVLLRIDLITHRDPGAWLRHRQALYGVGKRVRVLGDGAQNEGGNEC